MGRKGKTYRSDSDKSQAKDYTFRFANNKLAKMQRALKKQPSNTQLIAAIAKAEKHGITYTRNRKSTGHLCKGLYNSLGFNKNQPNEGMKKSKLESHWYHGVLITKVPVPKSKLSVRAQFEALGFNTGRHNGKRISKTNTHSSR